MNDDLSKMIDEQQQLQQKITATDRENESELTKALTFYVDDKIYGVEIPYVKEILGIPHITVVPGVPQYIKGIINVRSKVVPVVNIRSRFDMPEIEFDERTCTIIIQYKDVSVGLVVDEVLDVLPVTQKHKADIPGLENVNSNKFIDYILEMQDGIKLVLDIKKLLFDYDFTAIEEE